MITITLNDLSQLELLIEALNEAVKYNQNLKDETGKGLKASKDYRYLKLEIQTQTIEQRQELSKNRAICSAAI